MTRNPKIHNLRGSLEIDTSMISKQPPRPVVANPNPTLGYITLELDYMDSDVVRNESRFATYKARPDILQAHIPEVITTLYWRARKQVAFFYAFRALLAHGLVSIHALEKPIEYRRTTARIVTFLNMLCAFEEVWLMDEEEYDEPMHWLSCLVARSCVDQIKAFSFLAESGFLGAVSLEHLAEVKEQFRQDSETRRILLERGVVGGGYLDIPFEPNEDDSVAPIGKPPIFGMLLPSGVSVKNPELIVEAFMSRFSAIESSYKSYFGISDDIIRTEAEIFAIEAAEFAELENYQHSARRLSLDQVRRDQEAEAEDGHRASMDEIARSSLDM